MEFLRRLDKFHRTSTGLATFGVVELGAAYGLILLALDSGDLWQYGLAVILAAGSIVNFVKLVGRGLADVKAGRAR